MRACGRCYECIADAEAPYERQRGAETRRKRLSDVALRIVRERRASARAEGVIGHDRGALYVIPGHEDAPYEVWRVTSKGVVLRGVGHGGFLMSSVSGPFDPALWRRRE